MSTWIEVPAHRVLRVEDWELKNDFESVDESGNAILEGVLIYRIIRKSDRKVFRMPKHHRIEEDFGKIVYLEEI